MVKIKKKLSVAAPNKEVEGNSAGDNPPTQKKRGRPRKVVQETVKTEELNSAEDSKLKSFDSVGNKRSTVKKQTVSPEAGSGKNGAADKASSDEDPPKPKVVRREGSRRKSEPRRAAESFVPGR